MFFFFFNICAKYTKTLFWQAGIDKKLTKCNINGIILKESIRFKAVKRADLLSEINLL